MEYKLILLEDVENVGKLGDMVKVKPGFARNYLLPRGLAVKATGATQRQLEARKKQRLELYAKQLEEAQALAAKFTGLSVTIAVQATEDDKLYGSVAGPQIAETLAETQGLTVDPKQIALAEPIRQLGVYNVEVLLHPEVTTALKVWVVKG